MTRPWGPTKTGLMLAIALRELVGAGERGKLIRTGRIRSVLRLVRRPPTVCYTRGFKGHIQTSPVRAAGTFLLTRAPARVLTSRHLQRLLVMQNAQVPVDGPGDWAKQLLSVIMQMPAEARGPLLGGLTHLTSPAPAATPAAPAGASAPSHAVRLLGLPHGLQRAVNAEGGAAASPLAAADGHTTVDVDVDHAAGELGAAAGSHFTPLLSIDEAYLRRTHRLLPKGGVVQLGLNKEGVIQERISRPVQYSRKTIKTWDVHSPEYLTAVASAPRWVESDPARCVDFSKPVADQSSVRPWPRCNFAHV
jgi:hypothetical protein